MAKLTNLDRMVHQNLRVQEELAFSACKGITMCAVTLAEIVRLVIEYPIVFTKNADTGQFTCVALFGVDPKHNLFWRQGRWDSFSLPLNVGRHPFFIGLANNSAAGEGLPTLLTCIDLDNPAVQTSSGEPLFDASGAETPYLRRKMAILADVVEGEQKCRIFTDKLSALELIVPIPLELRVAGSPPRQINGLHSIDEQKLRAMDTPTLAELHKLGYLHAMHSMLSSLGHLQILAQRHAALAAPEAG
jgi:hypothetical protein